MDISREALADTEVAVPYVVLGALLSSAPTEIEEWAESVLGAAVVTRAIAVAEAASRSAA